jgi:hypothetical protein
MNIIKKITDFFTPKMNLVYQSKNGDIDLYKVNAFHYKNKFGNKKLRKENIGIRTWCYNRKGYRSFRYEGILSLSK